MAEPAPAANLENICESVLPLWSGQIESARTQTEEAIHSLSRFTAEQRALHGGSGQGVANSAGVTFF